ncbi:ribosome rescue protein RqcH [Oxyplasma meridianum]|uniref:Ribosome rescue protein RqcH n=1 Tax=Oxyplasma meridianum TaxID=3073602 RepID=A0AAX4NG34_9ARCH
MIDKFSSLDIHAFININMDKIKGSFIKKIYQVSPKIFLFNLYGQGEGKFPFYVDLSRVIAFYDPERPETPSQVTMVLRKSLSERRIVNVEQLNFDRVVKLTMHTGQEIIFELFREGNLIVTNSGKIEFVLSPREWRNRKLKVGEIYIPPSQNDPSSMSDEEVWGVLNQSKASLVQTLATRMNLGGEYSEELISRIGMEKSAMPPFEKVQTDKILEGIRSLMRESTLNKSYIYSEKRLFSPVEMKSIVSEVPIVFENFNKGLSHYILNFKPLDREKSPLERRIESQQRSIEEFRKIMEDENNKGKIIISNMPLINNLLSRIRRYEKEKALKFPLKMEGMDIDLADPAKKIVQIDLGGDRVELFYNKSPGENSSYHFDRSKEYRSKIEGALTAIQETQKMMNVKKVEKKKARSKQWFEIYHWFITSDGFLVIGGKDAKSNEKVVKKHMGDNDYYVHADIHGAPSTIVKAENGVKPSEKSLNEACAFALSFSRAWAAGMRSGSAYWVTPLQVSKTPESGEFISTGSWVIRGKRNYIFDLPLDLEVSTINYKGNDIPEIAPTGVIRKEEGKNIVRITPGDVKRNVIAREISKILGIGVEEIESILPPGSSQIIS